MGKSTFTKFLIMKVRPILFSTPMVQAILEGRKTQTRRVVKPQPPVENIDEEPCIDYDRGVEKGSMENPVIYAEWAEWQDEFVNNTTEPIESHCVYSPFGKEGDVLWVRETWQNSANNVYYHYKADFTEPGKGWKPSIFMPKDAARIWLKITDVRVERLNNISAEDFQKEGITWNQGEQWEAKYQNAYSYKFKMLWESINGENSWKQNPWVWVIEFERIEKPS